MHVSFSNIFAGILFGAIGFSAFMYGKKQMDYNLNLCIYHQHL